MKTRDQILTFLSQNKKLFRDKYHIVRIGLFGSYARGEQDPNSDIDLLVEFEEKMCIRDSCLSWQSISTSS